MNPIKLLKAQTSELNRSECSEYLHELNKFCDINNFINDTNNIKEKHIKNLNEFLIHMSNNTDEYNEEIVKDNLVSHIRFFSKVYNFIKYHNSDISRKVYENHLKFTLKCVKYVFRDFVIHPCFTCNMIINKFFNEMSTYTDPSSEYILSVLLETFNKYDDEEYLKISHREYVDIFSTFNDIDEFIDKLEYHINGKLGNLLSSDSSNIKLIYVGRKKEVDEYIEYIKSQAFTSNFEHSIKNVTWLNTINPIDYMPESIGFDNKLNVVLMVDSINHLDPTYLFFLMRDINYYNYHHDSFIIDLEGNVEYLNYFPYNKNNRDNTFKYITKSLGVNYSYEFPRLLKFFSEAYFLTKNPFIDDELKLESTSIDMIKKLSTVYEYIREHDSLLNPTSERGIVEHALERIYNHYKLFDIEHIEDIKISLIDDLFNRVQSLLDTDEEISNIIKEVFKEYRDELYS